MLQFSGSIQDGALSAAVPATSAQGTSALRPAAAAAAVNEALSAEGSAPAPKQTPSLVIAATAAAAVSVVESVPDQAAAPVASSTGTTRGEVIARIGSTAGTELAGAPSAADSNMETFQQSNSDAAKVQLHNQTLLCLDGPASCLTCPAAVDHKLCSLYAVAALFQHKACCTVSFDL